MDVYANMQFNSITLATTTIHISSHVAIAWSCIGVCLPYICIEEHDILLILTLYLIR